MSKYSLDASVGVGLVLAAYAIAFCLAGLVGGLCLEYSVEFWASKATSTIVDIPFWAAFLAGIPLVGLALPAAAITLLCSFFM